MLIYSRDINVYDLEPHMYIDNGVSVIAETPTQVEYVTRFNDGVRIDLADGSVRQFVRGAQVKLFVDTDPTDSVYFTCEHSDTGVCLYCQTEI